MSLTFEPDHVLRMGEPGLDPSDPEFLRGATGAWSWDLEKNRLWGDARFASLYGLDPRDTAAGLPSEAFFHNVHPQDSLRLRIAVAGISHGAEVFSRDYRLSSGQGIRWVSARGRAEHDPTGNATSFSGLLIDISEQKRVEEQLRIAQSAGGVGTFEYAEGFATATVSEQFCRLLGLHVAEALPVRTINGLVHVDDPPLIGLSSDGAQSSAELRIMRADNREERWIAVRGELRQDTEQVGDRFIGVIYDITATKLTETKLRELTRTLEARVEARTQERDRLWNSSRDLFAVVGAEGANLSVNPAWNRLLGYEEDELVGRPFQDLVHPEDRTAGRLRWPAPDVNAAPETFDVRVRAKDGDWRWVSWTVITYADAFYAVGRDVTERKQLEDQLRQSQKMEAVGQLTGGLAHDFNNMLTGILGGLDMIRRRVAEGKVGDAQRFLDSATNAAERAAALTHRLLAFSRRQTLDPQPLDVNALVASMQELLSRTLGEQVALEVSLDPELWTTLSDANQLESAILNLAINARDAMSAGGVLTIETRNVPREAAGGGKAGDFIALRVRDTGIGMPPDVVERAFDPFYTTKPLGQGTGLGLSMVYGFVHQSGGRVSITSQPQAGTTVELQLPRSTSEIGVDAEAAQPARAPGGAGETILVVEDDASVRILVVALLSELGYRVMEVADTTEALKILQSSSRIDLLVSDVGLPGLNGRQLAEIAREQRPELPVLFMTGYAAAAARRSEFLGPRMEMISKPFVIDALAVKIREMIEG